ncbi:hypothetical protein [Streptomyces sp. HC307]|uniref:hypothetical protein n=1 Tax=Streptomyces flavusporus TaxID=3385496 RepID=UPI003917399C
MTQRDDAWQHADRAADELREALAGAGITLPSLRMDLAAVTSGLSLVDMGRADADTVSKLAEVIRRGHS